MRAGKEADPTSSKSIPISGVVESPADAAGDSSRSVNGHKADGHEDESEHHGLETSDMVRIGIAAIVALLRLAPIPGYQWLAAAAVVFCGYPIYREALESIREKRMTMELSMTIALIAALLIREFFTALMIVLFVLVAEVIEGLTVGRGRKAIRDLLDLLPREVQIRDGNGERVTDRDALTPGQIVVVRPGARIPVDGVVQTGHSFVDQSTITGESMPVEKMIGSDVYAGTINQSGTLDVEARAIGRDTAFGRIIEVVERAERSRAPVQKVADRYAGYLVYFALACALLTFAITRDARSTISVVIVAGACGIAAGTPLAILGAIGRAAKTGVIVKGGLYLETLGKVTTVVLDKTGTLTTGKPRVMSYYCEPGVTRQQLLEAAATAEARSEHAIAEAVRDEAASSQIAVPPPDAFHYSPGHGVAVRSGSDTILAGNIKLLEMHGFTLGKPPRSSGLTQIYIARNGALLGSIGIADSVRPEAERAMRELRNMHLETILLSGDSLAAVQETAGGLGFTSMGSDLLPEQKAERIEQLRQSGKVVVMVGDGINDAPALVQANVGVAMGSGTAVAQESADAVLLGNDLGRLVETLHIARRCRRIIAFNFAGTLIVDAIGVGLAAFGLLSPLLAVTIHVTSELAFILNSARLLPSRPGREQSAPQN
jgi:heavy metal translocating P-type ATPase